MFVIRPESSGVCPGFLKGGGSNISWFPKKRSSDFKRGVQWSDRGGGGCPVNESPRTTNLAYLDAKGILISVKCCPKLHIKQLRNIYITFVLHYMY